MKSILIFQSHDNNQCISGIKHLKSDMEIVHKHMHLYEILFINQQLRA
jgi:hypothetical protein